MAKTAYVLLKLDPKQFVKGLKTAEKGTKRLPAGAHKIQFYAARFTTRYRSDNALGGGFVLKFRDTKPAKHLLFIP